MTRAKHATGRPGLGWLIATLLLLALTVVASSHPGVRPKVGTPGSPSPTSTVCVEDAQCWNCSAMGNHICGPTPGHPTERTRS